MSVCERKFKVEDELSGVTIITKEGENQTEENLRYGIIILNKLERISECTYRLHLSKVIKSNSGVEYLEQAHENEILEIGNGYYKVKSMSRISGYGQESIIHILNK